MYVDVDIGNGIKARCKPAWVDRLAKSVEKAHRENPRRRRGSLRWYRLDCFGDCDTNRHEFCARSEEEAKKISYALAWYGFQHGWKDGKEDSWHLSLFNDDGYCLERHWFFVIRARDLKKK